MSVLDKLKIKTRWDTIPGADDGYRLACSNPQCSLSCANIRNGRISTTSVHGNERHSYSMTRPDMAFAALLFLNTLSEKELQAFAVLFTKISEEKVMKIESI